MESAQPERRSTTRFGEDPFLDRSEEFVVLCLPVIWCYDKMDIYNKLHIKSSMDIKQHLNERDGQV